MEKRSIVCLAKNLGNSLENRPLLAVIETLNKTYTELLEKGYHNLIFRTDEDCDEDNHDYIVVVIYGCREETDDEVKRREEIAKNSKQIRYDQYLKLKKEFGDNDGMIW